MRAFSVSNSFGLKFAVDMGDDSSFNIIQEVHPGRR